MSDKKGDQVVTIPTLNKEEFVERLLQQCQFPEVEALLDAYKAGLNRYPDAIGVVLWVVLQMDSSRFGDSMVLIIGPSNTYKTVADCEGKWLGDLPSERRYPVAFITREELFS